MGNAAYSGEREGVEVVQEGFCIIVVTKHK